MIRLRKAAQRGHANYSWLDTFHTFSFADYYDPEYVNFGSLRVMNEDRVQPGRGFGMHGHSDMEIVTYILSGSLEHRDSLGNGSVLKAGEVQRMSAGTGIRHSESNPSDRELLHLYQIWLMPQRTAIDPSYEQKPFPGDGKHNRWRLVVSPDGADGSLRIHQDARIYLAKLEKGATLGRELKSGRSTWLQMLRGKGELDGQSLSAGDGAAISGENALTITATEEAEVMLFDLA
jgi:hypothetical protein